MKWFKFYGQDYLTDTKIMGMDPLLRQVWVTLLCLSNEEGEINDLREYDLIKLAGCDDDQMSDPSDLDRTKGCLKFFKDREMITVTKSNATALRGVTYNIQVVNYSKRQNENLTNAERQQKFRERHKIEAKTDSNVTLRYERNARIDKNRIDKNNKESREKTHTLVYLTSFPLEDFSDIEASSSQIKLEAEKALNWLKSNGKTKKDYKAFLRNWVLKTFPKKKIKAVEKPDLPEMSEEQRKQNMLRLNEMRGKLDIKSIPKIL